MSEFLAEARVLVRPDTTLFRAQLQAQLAAATRTPVVIPVALQPVGTAATGAARTSAMLAGSQLAVDQANRRTIASTKNLDAALLGLRTAAGSAAVIGLGALSLGAIVAGKALRNMLVLTAQFETELSTFQAVTGATADEMERVSEAAVQLGADVRLPAVSAGDAAVAMTELARAGLSVEESIAGAEGVLQLATAAQLDNASAAIITANALNSFGLAGDQAVRVADNFANAANAAQGSIADIGIAFRQASAAARQVGLSLEDTTSILALFAKNGLSGSDAGTALRTALIRLVAPTDAASKKIRELGINVRDAQGNLRADVFAQFGEATENLAPAARDAAAALIFGQDAFRAVAIGAREGTEGLRLMQFQIDQTGTAAEVAAARTQGLSGAFSSLGSASQTLGVSLGAIASGPLQDILRGTADLVVGVDALIAKLKDLKGASQDRELFPGGKQVDEGLGFLLSPGKAFAFGAKQLREFAVGSDETRKRISELNEELQLLQEARIGAERGGQRGVADRLTKEIKALREEINALKRESQGLSTSVTAPLEEALAALERTRDLQIGRGIDTGPIDRLIASLKESIPITAHVEGNFNRLRDDFGRAGEAASSATPKIKTLVQVLKQLQGASGAIQAEVLRLETEGGTPGQLIAALQEDIATQRDIIARSQRRGGPGVATAIEEARNQIKSDQAQIESLQNQLTSDAEQAADKAETARDKRDSAVQRQLEAATLPLERALDRASLTEGLRDDIRFTTALIELYKKQIAEAAKRIKDVETRNQVIAALENDLFQAILDRRRLQQENRERIRAALEERQETLVRAAEIRVEFADLTENTRKAIQARLKLIAALKREARVLKLQGNALLENRLERARIRKEIQDLADEGKKDQNLGAQLNFRILQEAQGFAANVMSNLIPAAAAAGTVGGTSPARVPEDLSKQAAFAEGRTGVSRGQGNETNSILRDILRALETLNGRTTHPEATRQRRVQAGSMDTVVL